MRLRRVCMVSRYNNHNNSTHHYSRVVKGRLIIDFVCLLLSFRRHARAK